MTSLQEAVAAASEIPEVAEYLEMQEEITALKEAIRVFMVENDIAYTPADNGRWTLIRRTKTWWNADKLEKLVGPKTWKRITKRIVDPEKIDDLVRQGAINRENIAPALESRPEKPHLRFFAQNEDDAADEEARLREAMNAT